MSTFDVNTLRYIQDPFAPALHADSISDIRTFGDQVRVTFERWSVNCAHNPPLIDRVCIGTVTLSRENADQLARALLHHMACERDRAARMHEAPEKTQ